MIVMNNMNTKTFCDKYRCGDEADVALCSAHFDEAIEEAEKKGYDKGYEQCKGDYEVDEVNEQ